MRLGREGKKKKKLNIDLKRLDKQLDCWCECSGGGMADATDEIFVYILPLIKGGKYANKEIVWLWVWTRSKVSTW